MLKCSYLFTQIPLLFSSLFSGEKEHQIKATCIILDDQNDVNILVIPTFTSMATSKLRPLTCSLTELRYTYTGALMYLSHPEPNLLTWLLSMTLDLPHLSELTGGHWTLRWIWLLSPDLPCSSCWGTERPCPCWLPPLAPTQSSLHLQFPHAAVSHHSVVYQPPNSSLWVQFAAYIYWPFLAHLASQSRANFNTI